MRRGGISPFLRQCAHGRYVSHAVLAEEQAKHALPLMICLLCGGGSCE